MAESSQNNSWVESYLEALLTKGLSSEYSKQPATEKAEATDKVDADRAVYAKYYVNQILHLGEEGIRDAWAKATSARQPGERDARLEYLSWRVWHMKRKKAQVAEEAKRHAAELDNEHGLDDEGTSDDDLLKSPRITGDAEAAKAVLAQADAAVASAQAQNNAEATPATAKDGLDAASAAPAVPKKELRIATIPTEMAPPSKSAEALVESWDYTPREESPMGDPFEGRMEGLYVILISLHGLVRGQKMELGRDADTGGQVKYVVELARAVAQHPVVHRVELLTRLIQDPKVDQSYHEEEECLLQGDGELGGAYIVRLPCGPTDVYLRKEKLWPHVREFADRGIAHAKKMLGALQEAGKPCQLYTIHGHYADAGEVAALMAQTLSSTEEVDMVMTGHSLGRNKLEHLLASGSMSRAEIEATYKIQRRIEAEERALDTATMVFTSTRQEVDQQWGLYDGFDPKLEQVLRYRRAIGRHMPFMNVIPPGLDFSSLKVDLPEDPFLKDVKNVTKPPFVTPISSPRNANGDASSGPVGESPRSEGAGTATDKSPRSVVPSEGGGGMLYMRPIAQGDPPIWQEIARFLRNPRKPCILAMSRPDAKKNITTLVKAFASNSTLRELANLVLIMGNRNIIDSMPSGSQKVLNQVLKLIDAHDLYGSVAYPKKHAQSDISDIYRLPALTHGVFTNVALQEPFGLTVIEAAAHGVPTVATKNGGPVDIMATLHHGLLVDPTNAREIADACLKILTNPKVWEEMSSSGVKNIHAYSWPAHCKKYLDAIEMEKRSSKHKKGGYKNRLSGSWDHRTLGLDDASVAAMIRGSAEEPAGGAVPLSAAHGGSSQSSLSSMDRLLSMPEPSAASKASIAERAWSRSYTNPEPRHSHTDSFGKAAAPQLPAIHDDSDLQPQHSDLQTSLEKQPRGVTRQHFMVVNLDSEAAAEAASAGIKALLAVRDSAEGSAGVGVSSMLGFDDSCRVLKQRGVAIDDLDWMVCNGGADIWHARDGAGPGWMADEQWEQHIDWRWDRLSLSRLLRKLLSGPTSAVAMGRAQSTATELRSISALPENPKRMHPHQLCLELDKDNQTGLLGRAGSIGKAASGIPATALLERVRRRLRLNGFRAHLTLQVVADAGGWVSKAQLHSYIHVTPLRASRALALRFLALKFGLDMECFTMVVVPTSLEKIDGDYFQIGALTSDLVELVSGAGKVWVRQPSSAAPMLDPSKLRVSDAHTVQRLKVRAGPKLFGERVALVPEEGETAIVSSLGSTGNYKYAIDEEQEE